MEPGELCDVFGFVPMWRKKNAKILGHSEEYTPSDSIKRLTCQAQDLFALLLPLRLARPRRQGGKKEGLPPYSTGVEVCKVPDARVSPKQRYESMGGTGYREMSTRLAWLKNNGFCRGRLGESWESRGRAAPRIPSSSSTAVSLLSNLSTE